MDEAAWLRVRPFDGTGRAIDVDLTFTATAVPITIQGQPDQNKGYGGLQYRPAAAPDVAITTESQGLVKEEATDRVPAPWADYSARFPGRAKRSGLAILTPPDHHTTEGRVAEAYAAYATSRR